MDRKRAIEESIRFAKATDESKGFCGRLCAMGLGMTLTGVL